MYTFIHTYVFTCKQMYLHAFIHKYIYTHIDMYHVSSAVYTYILVFFSFPPLTKHFSKCNIFVNAPIRGCYVGMKADLKARKQLNEFRRNYKANLTLGGTEPQYFDYFVLF